MKRRLDTSPRVSDEVKTTTCYMCACRCGIRVHLTGGELRYIEGNPDHPVNLGVLCAKGSAGIMHQHSPARLRKPLLRVGERGSGDFKEIEWEEALTLAADWLGTAREHDPRRLAFFTGRDQSQALTGWWARQYGTPNYAAHGGFCSVNMAAAGQYTIGGSFWEFGEPDWDHTRYCLFFGVAEDHASNPIKLGIARLRERGAKLVSINPVRTGYSAVADEWIAIRPGRDGLFVLSLVHELLRAGKVDIDYLARYTNAPWLVIEAPGTPEDGLFLRDEDGTPMVWHRKRDAPVPGPSASAALKDRVTLPDGRSAVPVFRLLAERYADDTYAPDAVAHETGVPAETIRRIAAELAAAAFDEAIHLEQPWTDAYGVEHERMIGRPVSVHAMRGISAHTNGFHTCRAIHLLQTLLGAIDTPGSFRYKPPFPKPIPPGPPPAGRSAHDECAPLEGGPLGFPRRPGDLLIDDDGSPQRIDKAYSWEAPLAAHGMMHTVIRNAWARDPYPIEVLLLYMANMAWNSAMNTGETLNMLTDKDEDGRYRIPRIIYSDAFYSEMTAYADLILPDTTYLERWDCISLLDRPISSPEGPADAIRRPVLAPDRDVRPFQDVLLDLGARLGLEGMVDEASAPQYPGGYPDYLINHERAPGIGSLAGWRGADGGKSGIGAPNPDQLDRYIEHDCFWQEEIPAAARYYKNVNRAYLDYAEGMGFLEKAEPVPLQIYSEHLQRFRLAAEGHGDTQPPDDARERVRRYFDPLPFWYPPIESEAPDEASFPLHAVTQRPMAMYHSWGSQNAWLRQIHNRNPLFVSRDLGERLGLKDGDWIWIISRKGRVKAPVRLMTGVETNTVWTWNAIGKRQGAWGLDEHAPENRQGFLLNHLIDDLQPGATDGHRLSASDPVTGQAAWFDLRVRIEKLSSESAGETEPLHPPVDYPELGEAPANLRYGADFRPGVTAGKRGPE